MRWHYWSVLIALLWIEEIKANIGPFLAISNAKPMKRKKGIFFKKSKHFFGWKIIRNQWVDFVWIPGGSVIDFGFHSWKNVQRCTFFPSSPFCGWNFRLESILVSDTGTWISITIRRNIFDYDAFLATFQDLPILYGRLEFQPLFHFE